MKDIYCKNCNVPGKVGMILSFESMSPASIGNISFIAFCKGNILLYFLQTDYTLKNAGLF